MLNQIKGLHHVTSLASSARGNNEFFTRTLGLRRVKKTVNFDAPDVYHLYYGDEVGSPGSVMTYFPFPRAARGRPGTGEVGRTSFAVPNVVNRSRKIRSREIGTTIRNRFAAEMAELGVDAAAEEAPTDEVLDEDALYLRLVLDLAAQRLVAGGNGSG